MYRHSHIIYVCCTKLNSLYYGFHVILPDQITVCCIVSLRDVAFSHDSKLMVSAPYDKTVRIWSAEMGDCQQTLEGHNDLVTSITFSHNSKLVASASDDKTVRIWSAKTGDCQQTLEGHSRSVTSVAFSHDSKLVASASNDETVRIWLTETGDCQKTLEGHSDFVTSMTFSHDSKIVASASWDRTVRIWSAETSQCQQTLNIGIVTWRLLFNHNSLDLYTDIGAISLNDSLWPLRAADASISKSSKTSRQVSASDNIDYRSGNGIGKNGSWITTNGYKLFWLPVNYRPSCLTLSHSTVVIGTSTGKVLIMQFSA